MTNFSDLSIGLADVVENTAQSVVTVLAQRPVSGTVVADGLVLTVAHVLHADEVQVQLPDGRTLLGVVAGRDPGSDLALLKVEGLNVPPLTVSAGARVGEVLVAVGRPQAGVQAALGLFNRQARGWLNSGAAPFRGVSGGALVDARGGLVGLLNAGLSRGALLAVPAERALKVADMLGSSGRVARGFLGIATQPVHFPDSRPEGHEPEAQPRGPQGERGPWGRGWGEREAGHRRADRPAEGQRGEGPYGEGRGRGGSDRGGPDGRGRGPWGRGGPDGREDGPMHRAMHREMRRELWEGRGRFGRGGRMGLTIVTVEDGSPAAQAGLKVGDILLALDGQSVGHPQELLRTVHDRAGEPLTLRVLRSGEEQDVTLTVGER